MPTASRAADTPVARKGGGQPPSRRKQTPRAGAKAGTSDSRLPRRPSALVAAASSKSLRMTAGANTAGADAAIPCRRRRAIRTAMSRTKLAAKESAA
jgi:hypothetical protein